MRNLRCVEWIVHTNIIFYLLSYCSVPALFLVQKDYTLVYKNLNFKNTDAFFYIIIIYFMLLAYQVANVMHFNIYYGPISLTVQLSLKHSSPHFLSYLIYMCKLHHVWHQWHQPTLLYDRIMNISYLPIWIETNCLEIL